MSRATFVLTLLLLLSILESVSTTAAVTDSLNEKRKTVGKAKAKTKIKTKKPPKRTQGFSPRDRGMYREPEESSVPLTPQVCTSDYSSIPLFLIPSGRC